MLTLHGPTKDLGGGFHVRRLLPSTLRRSVGPFVFFDHFGPIQVRPGDNHDVRPHPHIGLATVTYLFEGAMMHRDGLGSVQRIEPGAINWMTAGRGIVHSERIPDDLRKSSFTNHGLQLWVALPDGREECDPDFVHTAATDIPAYEAGGARVRVLVGEQSGRRSPVVAASPTLYLDLALDPGGEFRLDAPPTEVAVYPIDGPVEVNGVALTAGTMGVPDAGMALVLRASEPVRCAIVGGEPVGPRYLWWNFVCSSRERIAEAADAWRTGGFDRIAGDPEFIPLPDRPLPQR